MKELTLTEIMNQLSLWNDDAIDDAINALANDDKKDHDALAVESRLLRDALGSLQTILRIKDSVLLRRVVKK